MKNKIYNLIVLLTLFLGSQSAWAIGKTCVADYSYTIDTEVSSFTYIFNDLSTSTSQIVSWQWSFGDGFNSEMQNPEHQYFVEGDYLVTLSIVCQDGNTAYTEDTIHVMKVIPPSCEASFTYQLDTSAVSYTYLFTDHSVSPSDTILSWAWDFGDGSAISHIQNPAHQFTNLGSYLVKLEVTTQSGCTDLFSNYVVVSATPPSCNAYFTYSGDSVTGDPLLMFFFDNSTTNDPITSWLWDFADGNSSTNNNPVHLFPNPGIYNVTLTITTQGGCTATTNYPIQVGNPQKYNVWGRVYVGNLTTDKCIAYLYKELNNGFIVPIDTVRLTSVNDTLGVYYFYQILEGKHKLKVILPEISNYDKQYAPTYFGDDMFWTSTSTLNLNQDLALMNVNMEPIVQQLGSNMISGAVKKNNQFVKEEGIQVLLMNNQHAVYAYTFTDSLGKYEFKDVPMGNFLVYAEVTGLFSLPGYANFSTAYDTITNMNIHLNTKNTQVSIDENIAHEAKIQLKLFPNPVHGQMNIEVLYSKTSDLRYEILNILGQKQMHALLKPNIPSKINTEDLGSGIFILNVFNKEGNLLKSKKFISQ